VAAIRINARKISLGAFRSELDAAKAYDQAAVAAFGRFACVNFPGDFPEVEVQSASRAA